MRNVRRAAATLVFAALAATAHAVPIIAATSGLASPATTLDFTEVAVADDSALTNQFSAFGVNFSGLFYNGCPICATTNSGAKPDIGNFAGNSPGLFTPFSTLSFGPVTGVAFDVASNAGPLTFSAFLGATLVDSIFVNVATFGDWGYYGFDNVVIDRIEISSGQGFLIDNLEIGGAVPEPGTVALVGAGLLGLVALRRRAA